MRPTGSRCPPTGAVVWSYSRTASSAGRGPARSPRRRSPATSSAQALNERVVPALGMPGAYTARGRQFDSVVKYLMGADARGNDLPLRLQGLRPRYLPNMNYRQPDVEQEPTPGARAASTVHVRYRIDPGLGLTEDELNARVRRLRPAKGARSPAADPVYAERTGRITVPLLTLHETG